MVDDVLNELLTESRNNQRLSQFNSAMLDLYRMHVIISDCYLAAKNGDLVGWKRGVDGLFRELAAHFQPNELESYNKVIGLVVPAMSNYLKVSVFRKNSAAAQSAQDSAYTALSNYEVLVRRVMKRMGISLPSKATRSAVGGND